MELTVRVYRHPEGNLWAVRGKPGTRPWVEYAALADVTMHVDGHRLERARAGTCPRFGHAWVEGHLRAWDTYTPLDGPFMRADYSIDRGHFYLNAIPDRPLFYSPSAVFCPSGMWLPETVLHFN